MLRARALGRRVAAARAAGHAAPALHAPVVGQFPVRAAGGAARSLATAAPTVSDTAQLGVAAAGRVAGVGGGTGLPDAAALDRAPYPLWWLDSEGATYQAVLAVARSAASGLEAFHAASGVPWWGAIIAAGVALRVALLPLNIVALRNASRAADARSDMVAIRSAFAMGLQRVRDRPGNDGRVPVADRLRLMALMRRATWAALSKARCHPWVTFLTPMAQIPLLLAGVLGARHAVMMGDESFEREGALWFADLTLPDATYALPLASIALAYTSLDIIFGRSVHKSAAAPQAVTSGGASLLGGDLAGTVRDVFQVSLLLMCPFVAELPAGLYLLMLTNSAWTIAYVKTVRSAPVYRALTGREPPVQTAAPPISAAATDAAEGGPTGSDAPGGGHAGSTTPASPAGSGAAATTPTPLAATAASLHPLLAASIMRARLEGAGAPATTTTAPVVCTFVIPPSPPRPPTLAASGVAGSAALGGGGGGGGGGRVSAPAASIHTASVAAAAVGEGHAMPPSPPPPTGGPPATRASASAPDAAPAGSLPADGGAARLRGGHPTLQGDMQEWGARLQALTGLTKAYTQAHAFPFVLTAPGDASAGATAEAALAPMFHIPGATAAAAATTAAPVPPPVAAPPPPAPANGQEHDTALPSADTDSSAEFAQSATFQSTHARWVAGVNVPWPGGKARGSRRLGARKDVAAASSGGAGATTTPPRSTPPVARIYFGDVGVGVYHAPANPPRGAPVTGPGGSVEAIPQWEPDTLAGAWLAHRAESWFALMDAVNGLQSGPREEVDEAPPHVPPAAPAAAVAAAGGGSSSDGGSGGSSVGGAPPASGGGGGGDDDRQGSAQSLAVLRALLQGGGSGTPAAASAEMSPAEAPVDVLPAVRVGASVLQRTAVSGADPYQASASSSDTAAPSSSEASGSGSGSDVEQAGATAGRLPPRRRNLAARGVADLRRVRRLAEAAGGPRTSGRAMRTMRRLTRVRGPRGNAPRRLAPIEHVPVAQGLSDDTADADDLGTHIQRELARMAFDAGGSGPASKAATVAQSGGGDGGHGGMSHETARLLLGDGYAAWAAEQAAAGRPGDVVVGVDAGATETTAVIDVTDYRVQTDGGDGGGVVAGGAGGGQAGMEDAVEAFQGDRTDAPTRPVRVVQHGDEPGEAVHGRVRGRDRRGRADRRTATGADLAPETLDPASVPDGAAGAPREQAGRINAVGVSGGRKRVDILTVLEEEGVHVDVQEVDGAKVFRVASGLSPETVARVKARVAAMLDDAGPAATAVKALAVRSGDAAARREVRQRVQAALDVLLASPEFHPAEDLPDRIWSSDALRHVSFELGYGKLIGHGSQAAMRQFHPLAGSAEGGEEEGDTGSSGEEEEDDAASGTGAAGGGTGKGDTPAAAHLRKLAQRHAADRSTALASGDSARRRPRSSTNPTLQRTLRFQRAATAAASGGFTVVARSGLAPSYLPFHMGLQDSMGEESAARLQAFLERVADAEHTPATAATAPGTGYFAADPSKPAPEFAEAASPAAADLRTHRPTATFDPVAAADAAAAAAAAAEGDSAPPASSAPVAGAAAEEQDEEKGKK